VRPLRWWVRGLGAAAVGVSVTGVVFLVADPYPVWWANVTALAVLVAAVVVGVGVLTVRVQ
jgi:hypothetical protein